MLIVATKIEAFCRNRHGDFHLQLLLFEKLMLLLLKIYSLGGTDKSIKWLNIMVYLVVILELYERKKIRKWNGKKRKGKSSK